MQRKRRWLGDAHAGEGCVWEAGVMRVRDTQEVPWSEGGGGRSVWPNPALGNSNSLWCAA